MRKSDITPELVRKLIADQFPQWAALPVRLVEKDGWDNTTLRLGDDKSVRLPSADAYSVQVEKEHRWLPVLAPQLPLAIPRPLAKGQPGPDFPRPWSVYEWLPGEPVTDLGADGLVALGTDLARFLVALRAADAAGGPEPGAHNFHRGGDLAIYDEETRTAIQKLGDLIDAPTAIDAWDAARRTTWDGPPVWFHGDVAPGNLLVQHHRLTAVIDFGCSGVGDPACDLAMAWTFFGGESRAAFGDAVGLDDGTWARGRGWALWKAAITAVAALRGGSESLSEAGLQFGWRQPALEVVADVLAEQRANG
ncbi:putative aminoglycoside phosphotransferase [Saccharomonospora marina XMU15]|uniref:Putative aminoglycoside phosphotransferase n=1 Tax=Saccharomonospora marina XMU15 TaxID=882083 RepID=H5X6Z2_9PSEU|nr:aminoglycoside phosphotransferase family protein [Saccharomonospora marina]EHR52422.1 putative aminoglycoside phosphotransferase [Saccharomonospora marina XMU15]